MPYKAKKLSYLRDQKIITVFHPCIKFPGDRQFCFFPDESSVSGLIEYDNPEDALENAIMLYRHYVKDKEVSK